MAGKTILITGGTDGIGKAIALHLAQTGDELTIVGRNRDKGRLAQQEIAAATGAIVSFVPVDIGFMAEVGRFAAEFLATHQKLDVLVHSAGVILPEPVITKEGIEPVFATQYLSRYHLTQRLLSALNPGGKVLLVSGGNVTEGDIDYEKLNNAETFGMLRTVQNTSKAQSLLTLMLMAENPTLGIYNYGPGIVKTSIGRNVSGIRALIASIGQLFAVPPDVVGRDIAQLLSESHASGWYKRGIKRMPYRGEPYTAEQRELKRFSEALLSAI